MDAYLKDLPKFYFLDGLRKVVDTSVGLCSIVVCQTSVTDLRTLQVNKLFQPRFYLFAFYRVIVGKVWLFKRKEVTVFGKNLIFSCLLRITPFQTWSKRYSTFLFKVKGFVELHLHLIIFQCRITLQILESQFLGHPAYYVLPNTN